MGISNTDVIDMVFNSLPKHEQEDFGIGLVTHLKQIRKKSKNPQEIDDILSHAFKRATKPGLDMLEAFVDKTGVNPYESPFKLK
ncbi:MAG: hypothetical protein H8D23_21170 [Candidatus Brocadiales bacterium]|nr:hypothetical protein [Candidatus Brocadiales bacterium]